MTTVKAVIFLLTHVYSRSRRRRKSSDLYRRIWIVVSLSGCGVRLVTCRVELVGCPFRLFNAFKEGAMTTCSGRLFHTLATLLLKLLARILRRGLSLYNFLGYPLVDGRCIFFA